MVLSAPLIARLSRKLDPRLLIAAGLFLFAFSLWRMTPITSEWTGRSFSGRNSCAAFRFFVHCSGTNMARLRSAERGNASAFQHDAHRRRHRHRLHHTALSGESNGPVKGMLRPRTRLAVTSRSRRP